MNLTEQKHNLSKMNILFNQPFTTGNEIKNITKVMKNGHFRGNGEFTKLSQSFFEKRYGFKKCFLTNSCTDALEMCSILIDIQPGDEVIVPAYGYYSTANAFLLRGAKIIFADSLENHPNINPHSIASLITKKTKAIVVIHYAGVGCKMDEIMQIANQNNICVIEDAAQAIESKYQNKFLGTYGHLSTFSFHETKNIQSGEGGMLCINDEKYVKNAEYVWEKGTNKLEFESGKIQKYNWKSIGSSYSPNDYTAAFLYSQLIDIEDIQAKRQFIWNTYQNELKGIARLKSDENANAHSFYIICKNADELEDFQATMAAKNIQTSVHYQALHKNDFLGTKNLNLPNSEYFSKHLIRLPFHLFLSPQDLTVITQEVKLFFKKK